MEARIIFATGNENKMKEIREILSGCGMQILSMKEAGITADVVEDGSTFEENACIKVRQIAKAAPDDIILADDSGLEIDYLNKEPGIYSARYMGEETSYDVKNQALLYRLNGRNGFGYDPIFYVDEYGCSTAELTMEQKNAFSHRGNALRMVKEELKRRGVLEK